MARGKCMQPTWSYNGFAIENTSTADEAAAICSSACTVDATLCWGFFLRPLGSDAIDAATTATHAGKPNPGKYYCATLSGWDDANVKACTAGHVVGRSHTGPLKAPPVPPKRAPKGAKNVLFLMSDDMRPVPHILT